MIVTPFLAAGLLALAASAHTLLCESASLADGEDSYDDLKAEQLSVRSAIAGSHWPRVEDWTVRRGVDAAVTANGRSALSIAAEQGALFIVRGLLEAAADLQHCDKQGLSVLMYAARKGHAPVVHELLCKHAAPDEPVDMYGNAPIHAAAGFGHSEVLRELLLSRCDADQRTGDVRAPEEYGARTLHEAPLHLACRVKPAHLETQSRRLVVLLLEFGANPCLQDDSGDTAAHHLARKGDVATLWALLSRSPPQLAQAVALNLANARGLTPLDEASESGNISVRLALICGPRIGSFRHRLGLAADEGGSKR